MVRSNEDFPADPGQAQPPTVSLAPQGVDRDVGAESLQLGFGSRQGVEARQVAHAGTFGLASVTVKTSHTAR
jgi:hypothetical protein